MTVPRFQVDFNELLASDLILLSKGDTRSTFDGHLVALDDGMEVEIFEEDYDDQDTRDDVVATGRVERNTTPYATHVKWCCRIDGRGIRHESDPS